MSAWTRAKRDTIGPGDVIAPWGASGPGWSNEGLWVYRDGQGKPDVIYRQQLGPVAGVLFEVALKAANTLWACLRSEGHLKDQP
jgi:hypothetical protein